MSDPKQSFVLAAVVVAVGLGLGISAPRGPEVSPPRASPGVASLGQPFVLHMGDSAVLEGGIRLMFASVMEDSRCPTDVQCVWEGNAEIAIEVGTADEPAVRLSLNTNPGFATEATFRSYTISLIDLQPYPSTAPKTVEPYRASLVVSPAGDPPPATPNASPSATA
jgi:hypothetical protein